MKKDKSKANVYIVKCAFCGNTFTCYNRSRVFCPDKNCKDCYHNQKKLVTYHLTKNAVKTLVANYYKLKALSEGKLRKVNKAELDEVGFDFDAFVKHAITMQETLAGAGDRYFYAGYALRNLGNNNFEIIPPIKRL